MATEDLRITARVDPDIRALLQSAAKISGMPTINAFVVSAAVDKAKTILENEKIVRLNEEATLRLLDALENPPAPTPALSSLFKKHSTPAP